MYTFNVKDFHKLHKAYLSMGRSHAGIMFAQQQRYTLGEQVRRLLRLMAAKSAEQMKDHVEFLSAWWQETR